MSFPAGPTPLPAGPSTERRYVVHTDRRGLNRLHGGIVTMHAVVLVGILVLIGWLMSALGDYLSWYSLLPFVIFVLGQCAQIALHTYAWGRRSALSEPMVIEPAGFTMNTAAGELRIPWAVVTSVTVRRVPFGRVLVVGLRPDFLAAGPPAGTSFSRRQWRFVQRRGLLLGEKGLQEDLDDIAGAMNYFGRGPLVR